ncbi:MAG: PAS domain S-box protein [Bacteroidota bacterium]|nr:PAS domain S-box protein [Bacteroidota bacterium]
MKRIIPESTLNTIVNDSLAIMILVDSQAKILFANKAFESIVKCPNSEIIGKSFISFTDQSQKEHTLEQIINPIDKELGNLNLTKIINGAGTFMASFGWIPTKYNIIDVDYYLIVGFDISYRRNYSDIVEQMQIIANIGGWEYRLDTEYWHYTDHAYTIHGLNVRNRPGRVAFEKLYSEDSKLRIQNAHYDAIHHQKIYDIKLNLTTPIGEEKIIRSIGHPLIENGIIVGMKGTVQDITYIHKTEQKLAINDAYLNTIFGGAPIGVFTLDEKGELNFINNFYKDILKLDLDAINNRELNKVFLDDIPQTIAEYTAFFKNEEKEFKISHNLLNIYNEEVCIDVKLYRLIQDEENLGYIGFSEDVTQQRKVEKGHKELLNNLKNIYYNAPIGVFLADSDGKLSLANPFIKNLLGLQTENVNIKDLIEVIHPINRFKFLRQWLQSKSEEVFEFNHQYKLSISDADDVPIFISIKANLLKENGENSGYVGFIDNISKRQNTLLELQKTKLRLLETNELAKLGAYDFDLETMSITWDGDTWRGIGVEPVSDWNEYIKVIHPEDVIKIKETLEEIVIFQKNEELEIRYVMPDGQFKYIYNNLTINQRQGKKPLVKVVAQDITDRRRAEVALLERDEYFREAQKVTRLGICEINLKDYSISWANGTHVSLNVEAFTNLYDYEPYVNKDDINQIWDTLNKVWPSELSWPFNLRSLDKDGVLRFLKINGKVLYEMGKPYRLYLTILDITDQVLNKKIIDDRANRLKQAYKMASVASYDLIWNESGGIDVEWIDNSFEHLCIPCLSTMNDLAKISISPNSTAVYAYIERSILEKSKMEVMIKYVDKFDEIRYANVIGIPEIENEKLIRMVCTAQDITKQVRIENELKESREFLREAQKLSGIASFKINKQSRKIIWEGNSYDNINIPKLRFVSEFLEILSIAEQGIILKVLDEISINGGTSSVEFEYKDLEQKSCFGKLLILNNLLPDQEQYLNCSLQNITNIKLNEMALSESRKKLLDTQMMAQLAGFELIWPSMETIWLSNTYEALNLEGGLTWRGYMKRFDKEKRPHHIKYLKDRLKTEVEFECEIKYLDKDKCFRVALVRGIPLKNENNILVKYACTAQDITSRYTIEQALRESETKLEEAQTLAELMTWELDIQAQMLTGSYEFKKMYGLTDEQPFITLTDYMSFIDPKYHELVAESIAKVIEGEAIITMEVKTLDVKGDTRYKSIKARPGYNLGLMTKIYGTALDITQRKLDDIVLRESKEKLTEAQRMAGLSTWELDLNTRQIIVDQSILRLYGININQLGMSLDVFINTLTLESKEDFNKCIADATSKGRNIQIELHSKIDINTDIYWLINGKAAEGLNGINQQRLYGAALNITQRKLDELIAAESQQKLAEAQKMANLSTWEYVLNEGITFGAQDLISRYGVKAERPIVPFENWISFVAPHQRVQIDSLVHNSIKENINFQFEMETIGPDGQTRYATVMGRPVMKNGIIDRLYGTSLDITTRKLNEIALSEAKIKAEQATLAKSQFLSTMSHELRTPLNAVIAMTHLLMDDDPKDEQLENLSTLKFSAEGLLSLINDILDFSKIEAGKINFEEIDFNIRNIFKGILRSHLATAEEHNSHIHLNIDEGIPLFLIGDPLRLTQVVNNLVSNAVKFTQNGTIAISVTPKLTLTDNVTLQITVNDTGIGIPADTLPYIFDSFTQAAQDTTRKFGGTGLGLAITSRLLALMGSKIEVNSQLNTGSTFHFTLKFKTSKLTKDQSLSKLNSEAVEIDNLKGVNILIAEDNKINQMVVSKFLDRWQANYMMANNGQEAVELALSQRFDLILMDLQMPVMNGHEATSIIKDIHKLEIPIIALTAAATNDMRDLSLTSGMCDFVTKPINPNELFKKIKKWAVKAIRV